MDTYNKIVVAIVGTCLAIISVVAVVAVLTNVDFNLTWEGSPSQARSTGYVEGLPVSPPLDASTQQGRSSPQGEQVTEYTGRRNSELRTAGEPGCTVGQREDRGQGNSSECLENRRRMGRRVPNGPDEVWDCGLDAEMRVIQESCRRVR